MPLFRLAESPDQIDIAIDNSWPPAALLVPRVPLTRPSPNRETTAPEPRATRVNRSPNGSDAMNRFLLLAAAANAISRVAFAHAFLDRASPAVGSEVSGSPPALSLTYTEPVEPLFSTVHVTDASGARVDEGKPTPQEDGGSCWSASRNCRPGFIASSGTSPQSIPTRRRAISPSQQNPERL